MTRRTAIALATSVFGGSAAQEKKVPIRGMYASPKPFWDTGARLPDYGVNALFVHGSGISQEVIERAHKERAQVYAEFPTLNGKGYIEKHPEAWPVNEQGERAPAATWFMGACPTEPKFREFRKWQLNVLLSKFDVAGVFMDYVHWHAQFEDPNPVLPETCFCDSCVSKFQKDTGRTVPGSTVRERAARILGGHDAAWRTWRCRQLVEWAQMLRAVIREKRPGTLLGAYHCPWTDEDFNGARRRILGIDIDMLANEVDVFSPMVYHAIMGRAPEWVGENVEWWSRRLQGRAKLWPIVQALDKPREISPLEFNNVLRLGATGAATGIMMFTVQAVASNKGKLEAMGRLYRSWS
ncbi:MAG: hypothetical protein KJZ84_08225 [Bryobacteraceae bacterium]|nr:hypothetical protein [Bryobacteraceae bacterium]